MDATTIPKRWITSRHQALGRAEAIAQAWIDAGKPAPFEAFRKGYEAHSDEAAKQSAGPTELVAELETNGRLLYLAYRQMSSQQRSLYLSNARAAGIDVGDDNIRGDERHAVIKRFGGAQA